MNHLHTPVRKSSTTPSLQLRSNCLNELLAQLWDIPVLVTWGPSELLQMLEVLLHNHCRDAEQKLQTDHEMLVFEAGGEHLLSRLVA